MKRFIMFTLLGITSVFVASAQTKPAIPTTTPADSLKKPGAPVLPAANKNLPKPFEQVITEKAVTRKGMITTHRLEDKYFFEISDSTLGRDILVVSRISKGGSTIGYAGDQLGSTVIRFDKGPSNRIFMRKISYKTYGTDSTTAMYQNLQRSNIQPIAASFAIAAYSADKKGSVVDMTDYINSDNDIFYFGSAVGKAGFRFSAPQLDKSYIVGIKSFPKNVEISVVKTYMLTPAPPKPGSAGDIDMSSQSSSATVELNVSMVMLPKVPMKPRYSDARIGYFTVGYTDFDANPQGIKEVEMIRRWRLEPKPEDIAAYKKGILVEPKKPIVYYIDPATPKKWIPYLIAGVNDWQKAFEKAGFKNAIIAKVAPTNKQDSTWSLEDAQHSAIVYKPSELPNATGPSIADPRSGEIIESHINWYHNVMKLVHDWYMIQASAIDPRARKMEFSDELMGQLIRFVSSHEVGHTLGLRHNFGSSSTVPSEKLRDKAFVEANGHTPSIMDYARFNYVAQPEDNISPKGIYPRIGDYDFWAIEWGYKFFDNKNAASEVPILNKLTIEKLKNNRLWFGSEANLDDPRSQSEDLGDNAMISGEYGIKNLKRVLVNLPEWTKADNEGYGNLKSMYSQLIGQMVKYMGHVSRNVGGVMETPKTVEQEGPIYQRNSAAKQKEAMAFLDRQLFKTPSWLLDRKILEITGIDPTYIITLLQMPVTSKLLDNTTLKKLMIAEAIDGQGAYKITDLLGDLTGSIFTELKTGAEIDIYRRNLQKSYVNQLINFVNGQGAAAASSTDVSSVVKGELKAISNSIKTAPKTINGQTKMHLEDLNERIDSAFRSKE
ncbi:zinc-dependent metalloprotease [Pedobacter miscanthi]|uniref:zinc-dependent metalloprotease n=1 Tax=Pedobacter miscanthi TaxID=2259170 RepID=UPI00292E1063|nr:zinc-dependent metalloprotease [Pedobacter miscanthi]